MLRNVLIIAGFLLFLSPSLFAAEGQGEMEASILNSKDSDIETIKKICAEKPDSYECDHLKDSLRIRIEDGEDYIEDYDVLTLNLK